MSILIVDDDYNVRNFIADYLEQLGFSVIQAESGPKALQALQENQEIHLLFSDICMPGMNGLELAKICHQSRPGLPIILVSGYHENFDLSPVKSIVHSMISKPFDLDTIVEAIQRAIVSVERKPLFVHKNLK